VLILAQQTRRLQDSRESAVESGNVYWSQHRETQAGQSRADFISKNAIALKEARETHYWLRLLIAASVLPESRLAELRDEAEELMRIIGAILVSTEKNLKVIGFLPSRIRSTNSYFCLLPFYFCLLRKRATAHQRQKS
jgi:four helix bundle protein